PASLTGSPRGAGGPPIATDNETVTLTGSLYIVRGPLPAALLAAAAVLVAQPVAAATPGPTVTDWPTYGSDASNSRSHPGGPAPPPLSLSTRRPGGFSGAPC